MKIYPAILSLLASLYCCSQNSAVIDTKKLNTFDFEAEIFKNCPRFDSTKHIQLRHEVARLSQHDNYDSLQEAATILYSLLNNMPGTYTMESFEKEKRNINQFLLNRMKQAIGSWKSESLGTIWSDDRKMYNPDRKIVCTDNTISFYKNDKLVRTTTYKVVIDEQRNWNLGSTCMILTDTKEKWRVSIIEPGQYAPWYGDAKQVYLLLRFEPNCFCGCHEKLYSRILPPT